MQAVVSKATIKRLKIISGKDIVLSRPWFAMKARVPAKTGLHVLHSVNKENVAVV